MEAWNSNSIQNAHASMHILWEQIIEKWLQTKFTLQQYDLNFVVDALQSKIIYLTGNSCKLTGINVVFWTDIGNIANQIKINKVKVNLCAMAIFLLIHFTLGKLIYFAIYYQK